MTKQKKRGQGGFTLVELLIAAVMFSIVVLVALSGFVEIGRIFFKGNVLTSTQQTLKNVSQNINSDVQSNSQVTAQNAVSGYPGLYYFCVGNVRYTYSLSKVVLRSSPISATNLGAVRDQPGGTGCPLPFGGPTPISSSTNPSEMLGDQMRLNVFCVSTTSANLYNVELDAVTGTNNVLQTVNNTTPSNCKAAIYYDCNSQLSKSQYCARSDLKTTIAGGRF